MHQYRRAAPFIIVATLAYLIWRDEEAGVAAIVAMLSLGAGFAILYRPDFRFVPMIVSRNRRDAALLAMSVISAFCAIGWIDWWFTPAIPSDYVGRARLARHVVWWLHLAVGTMATLPFLGQIARNHRDPGRKVAQWPAAIGPATALLMAAAVFILWGGFGEWAVVQAPAAPTHLIGAIAVMGMAGLLGGIAMPLWWRAMTAGDAARFDSSGVFARAMQSMALGIGIGAVLAAFAPFVAGTGRIDEALAWGTALMLMMAAAWLAVLWQVRDVEPASHGTAVAGIAILLPIFPLSLFPAAAVANSGIWFAIVLLFCGPMSIVIAVRIVRRMPDALRDLRGRTLSAWPILKAPAA